MSPALEQLVREAMDVTGSPRPDLLEDDAPILADAALAGNDGEFYSDRPHRRKRRGEKR